MPDDVTRRDFLRVAAGAASYAVLLSACASGSEGPGQDSKAAVKSRPVLRIAQWSATAGGIAGYDEWFDAEYTQRWGEEHGVRVSVDHFRLAELPGRAEAEVAAQAGHDVFTFLTPPAALEDHVVDHRTIIEQVEAELGAMTPLMNRSVFNPVTRKYYGFPEFWTAQPVHYRRDLWEAVEHGSRPAAWEDLVRLGPGLSDSGHPVGIGLSADPESTLTLLSLMHSYGSSVQDQSGHCNINTPATVEAVKVARALFEAGMDDEVYGWDAVANNRFLVSGRGSLILNGVSAMRAVELQEPDLAEKILLLPALGGPSGPAAPGFTGVSVIWKFSKNIDLAEQFLMDQALAYREAFIRSQFYKMPAFPGSVPDLAEIVLQDSDARPPGKYDLLADAAEWTTNLGHPGHANAAIDEILQRHLIPKMFAAAARGEKTPEQAVADAEAEAMPIFDKWRQRGKI